MLRRAAVTVFLSLAALPATRADDMPVAGLIPKAPKPVVIDGSLDEWDGAFVTPVHVGHPDFANRGGEFLFLWDEQNLYVGLRCLDQKPAHVGPDDQIWNGDAVEFYLDTRQGEKAGTAFGSGSLHMFWTPFTGTEVKPRWRVRDLPAFKDLKLQGVEMAGKKTPWGYTAEFKLPWANFPDFAAKSDEVIGLDCELCSSDGGPRVDRTFVYSSPDSVGSPKAFGRVRLVDTLDPTKLALYSRVLLPLSVTQSANYSYVYATACVSPTIEKSVAKIEGKITNAKGKATPGTKHTLEGSGFVMWDAKWELFDLPPGEYTVEATAYDKDGGVVAQRKMKIGHGDADGK
jgi:hypothetical protein